jgi:hypothetical protein
MAGMDANLSLSQAKAQQERIQHGSQHQGPKKSSKGMPDVCEKASHQGK